MKKLLSLLGAVAISGSGVASVTACNNNNKEKTKDSNFNKINNKTIRIDYQAKFDNVLQYQKEIYAALTNELKVSNSQNIKFTNPNYFVQKLSANNWVTTNLEDNGEFANFRITFNDLTFAQKLKQNVVVIDQNLSESSDLSNSAVQSKIKAIILKNNPLFNNNDLNKVSFNLPPNPPILNVNNFTTLDIRHNDNDYSIKVFLIHSNDQNHDNNLNSFILNNFNIKNIDLPPLENLNLNSFLTKQILITNILDSNTDLTYSQFQHVSFKDYVLSSYTTNEVEAIITNGVITSKLQLNITVNKTQDDLANEILAKINNLPSDIVAVPNIDITNKDTITALRQVLQDANSDLTNSDLLSLQFTGVLTDNTQTEILINVTLPNLKNEHSIKWNITASVNQDIAAQNLARKMNGVPIQVAPQQDPFDLTLFANISAIKAALTTKLALTSAEQDFIAGFDSNSNPITPTAEKSTPITVIWEDTLTNIPLTTINLFVPKTARDVNNEIKNLIEGSDIFLSYNVQTTLTNNNTLSNFLTRLYIEKLSDLSNNPLGKRILLDIFIEESSKSTILSDTDAKPIKVLIRYGGDNESEVTATVNVRIYNIIEDQTYIQSNLLKIASLALPIYAISIADQDEQIDILRNILDKFNFLQSGYNYLQKITFTNLTWPTKESPTQGQVTLVIGLAKVGVEVDKTLTILNT